MPMMVCPRLKRFGGRVSELPDNAVRSKGCLITVVGPSGSGKDTIMRAGMEVFSDDPDVYWVRRVITRASEPGREDHDSVSAEQFKKMSEQGEFAVQWHAHGLSYGVPVSIHQHILDGKVVIANGSRAALDDFRQQFKNFKAVWINASEEVLVERLVDRGTESVEAIRERLQRRPSVTPDEDDVVIDNNGQVDESVEQLINLILGLKPG